MFQYVKTDISLVYESGSMKVGEVIKEATAEQILKLSNHVNSLQEEDYNSIEKIVYTDILLS